MVGDLGEVVEAVGDHVAVGAVTSIMELVHEHHPRDVVDNHVRSRVFESEEDVTLGVFNLNISASSVLAKLLDVVVDSVHHVRLMGFDVGIFVVSIPSFKGISSRNCRRDVDHVDREGLDG
jgi:hypothetical protein